MTELEAILNRLSEAALLGDGDTCEVSRNDLSTLLLEYHLGKNRYQSQQEQLARLMVKYQKVKGEG